MRRVPLPVRFPAAIVAALLISLVAVGAYAQLQTGNIYGRVQSKDGATLPGVTVSLTGVGAPQTFVTDSTGQFRFLSLSPGKYSLKAELSGFGTVTRNGVTINVGRNADVTLTLNPAAAEAITVTAEAPLLDVRKTGTGADVAKVELEKVPTGRDPWVILQETPGVLMDRFNVGGNQSGQQSSYVSKGTSGVQSTWNVDGVNITDFAATGSSPTYYDFDSFEEMQMTTGGTDPRIQTPGVQINMVTKRGTNEFKGSARAFHTSSSYQAKPKIPAEATYLSYVNQINLVNDDGGELGGPIIHDKLWIWGAFAKQQINNLTPTLLSSGARSLDKTTLKGENLKLNAQPLASNSLAFVDSYDSKIKLGRNVGTTRAPETGWNQNDDYSRGTGSLSDPTLWKIEDTQIIGSNLYLTGLYSKVQGGFQLISDNGQGCASYACGLASLPAYQGLDGSWHRSYLSEANLRPQRQARLDGSAFMNTASVSHELKFGFGYRKADVNTALAWPGDQWTEDIANIPNNVNHNTGEVALIRSSRRINSGTMDDAYVGDTVMLGSLLVQASVRYDQQKASTAPGASAANPTVPNILPAISFGGVSGLKWNNVSPRLGLTYTLGQDRRTLVRASYSRYVNQIGGNSVPINAVSPGATAYAYYYFNDLNGDHIAQPNEIDFSKLINHIGYNPANPAQLTQFTRWASNVKAPITDEFILGGEREILPEFSLGINVTYRKLSDFTWTVGEKHQGVGDVYSTADYVPHAGPLLCITGSTACPATNQVAFLPGGVQTLQLPTYYVLAPGISAPTFNVVENRPDYNQTYKGLELVATKRMANRWMLRGNFTLQNWKQHVGASGIVDPTMQRGNAYGCDVCNGSDVIIGSGSGSGSFGGVYINSKWAYSLTGAYQIPVIETSLGMNLTGRQGYALPYVFRASGSAGEGFKFLIVGDSLTQYRNQNVRELDLRLAKDVHVYRGTVTLSVDGFNVLDSQTVLQRDVRRLQLAANHVTETMSPRVFRLGARVSF